ncbi:MAG: phospholipid carrier-dependent glycosyltransferase [bacterium]
MNKLLPFVITVMAGLIILLRFFQLGTIPQGIHADEASYGYDAYSLLKTGRDQWGQAWPLSFKSFGDYKLNLPYLIIPAIKLVGLTTTATRLPSAIFGLLTVIVLYLTLQLFRRSPILNGFLTLIFATSPWAFGISRLFFESNVALFFYTAGMYSMVRAIHTQRIDRIYYLGIILFSLAGYFYAPLRFIGLATVILGLCYTRLAVVKTIILYLLVALPILSQFFSGVGLTRLNQESSLRAFEYSLVINENRDFCYQSLNHNPLLTKACYLYWNKPLMRIEAVIQTIFAEFSPHYLFLESADNYIVPPSTGPYLYYLLPLFLLGALALFMSKQRFFFIFFFVALAVAASAAKVSLYRNTVGLYLAFFPIAAGFYFILDYCRSRLPDLTKPLMLAFVLISLFFQSRYLAHYFLVYSRSTTFAWSADAEYIARYIGKVSNEYRTVIDKSAGDFGPLYVIFYNVYDPKIVQSRAEWTTGDPRGWTRIGKLGNIASADPRTIRDLICEKASAPQDDLSALYITFPLEDYSRFADQVTRDWRDTKTIHEIYDIDSLFSQLMSDNPANLTRLCPIETARWK